MPWVAIAIAALAAAGTVAKGEAARKAAGAMKDAIGNVERIDVAKENDIARKYDEARYRGQLELQAKVDPTAAALRTTGMEKLLASLNSADDEKALELVRKLADENGTEDPTVKAVKQKLVDDALADLNRGATLSPDFQAELVRAGLESGAKSGLGIAPGSAGAQASRKLLGAAGEQLKQQRATAAESAVSTVANLQAARTNILTGTAAMLANLTGQQAGKAANAAQIGYSLVPQYGLSGSDAVNIDFARLNQAQQLALASGSVEAQKRLAQGEMIAGLFGAGSQALGGLAGAGALGSGAQSYMQGAGGGMGGGFGGMGQLQGTTLGPVQGPNRAGWAGSWDRFWGSGGYNGSYPKTGG